MSHRRRTAAITPRHLGSWARLVLCLAFADRPPAALPSLREMTQSRNAMMEAMASVSASREDVQAATKAIPAYMRELGASIYTAARDASFVQHAERALQGQYRSFDNCDLRVIGTDKATGKTATTLQTTVSRGRMAPDRGAYAKTLQLGATN